MIENYFELNIPLFRGLHSVFNLELLRLYFPPLLETSNGIEILVHKKLNHD